jgi:hypothetical protein
MVFRKRKGGQLKTRGLSTLVTPLSYTQKYLSDIVTYVIRWSSKALTRVLRSDTNITILRKYGNPFSRVLLFVKIKDYCESLVGWILLRRKKELKS